MNAQDDFFSELAFRDLSANSKVFRQKLIDEFELLDNLALMNTVKSPQYTTRDIRGFQNTFSNEYLMRYL